MTNQEELKRIRQLDILLDRIFVLSNGVDPEWRKKQVRVLNTRTEAKTRRPLVVVERIQHPSGAQHEVLPSHCLPNV